MRFFTAEAMSFELATAPSPGRLTVERCAALLTQPPKLLSLVKWSDADIGPPAPLVTDAMQFPVMIATERHGKFIAYLSSQGPGLSEF